MGLQLTEKAKNIIIKQVFLNKKVTNIAKKIKKPYNTVKRFIDELKSLGKFNRKKGSGRNSIFSEKDVNKISHEAKKDGKRPAIEIYNSIKQDNISKISTSTLRRALNKGGLKNRKAAKKPKLSVLHKKKRFLLAKKWSQKPLEYWETIIFSDESTFRLCGTSGSQFIWRENGTRFDDKNVISTEKFGGGGVMAWGFITFDGRRFGFP